MASIKEDTIAKISWGVLGSMALGLIAGTTYVVKLSYASDIHAAQIVELKAKQVDVIAMQTDVAVIKEQVHQIKEMLEGKGR